MRRADAVLRGCAALALVFVVGCAKTTASRPAADAPTPAVASSSPTTAHEDEINIFAPSRVPLDGPPPVIATPCSGGTATIRGRVVDDSTSAPIPNAWISLYEPDCQTVADESGRFELTKVSLDTDRIAAGKAGYRHDGTRRPVSIASAGTTEIELRLRRGGPLEDCRAIPACAPLVDGGHGTLTDDDAGFWLVALGTLIALKWPDITAADPHWYACFEGESPEVLAALRARYSPVVPASECDRPLTDLRKLRSFHAATGAPAFTPELRGFAEIAPGRRNVVMWFYVGPRSASMWECELVRGDRGWRPTLCLSRGVA
jgi:hypothetical protein